MKLEAKINGQNRIVKIVETVGYKKYNVTCWNGDIFENVDMPKIKVKIQGSKRIIKTVEHHSNGTFTLTCWNGDIFQGSPSKEYTKIN